MIDSFKIYPLGYKDKVNAIFAAAGTDSANACIQLKQLINEAESIIAAANAEAAAPTEGQGAGKI